MHSGTIEDWYNTQSNGKKRMIRKILNRGDKLIALGHSWEPFLKTLVAPEKVEVVYNAVPVPSENCYNPNATEILFFALLIQGKGIDDLLDAVRKIRNQLPTGVIVRLYGADRENNIDRKIYDRHLEEIVVNSGWLPAEKRKQCFSRSMINVLPSYHEGLPMTILETMAYGIPNIATRVGAIPEAVIDGENGILINPGDVEGLAAALLLTVNNSELREKYSENAYQYARDHFDLRQHLNQVYELYQSLC
jgi:glycosyltransferase involved in cell wall biosynthesis